MSNYQEATFYPLSHFSNPVLVLLGQDLKRLRLLLKLKKWNAAEKICYYN
ncbi:hypothetical protein [Bathymodiolus thermophilus thioautotrophic gill symbiont]|nr:hypothetical protein [Bathymodiolus thermophilus thioautotrophic gill symbiont]